MHFIPASVPSFPLLHAHNHVYSAFLLARSICLDHFSISLLQNFSKMYAQGWISTVKHFFMMIVFCFSCTERVISNDHHDLIDRLVPFHLRFQCF